MAKSRLIFKIPNADLKEVAIAQGYKPLITVDSVEVKNPESDVMFALEFLANKLSGIVEHETTYNLTHTTAPSAMVTIKENKLTSLKADLVKEENTI